MERLERKHGEIFWLFPVTVVWVVWVGWVGLFVRRSRPWISEDFFPPIMTFKVYEFSPGPWGLRRGGYLKLYVLCHLTITYQAICLVLVAR